MRNLAILVAIGLLTMTAAVSTSTPSLVEAAGVVDQRATVKISNFQFTPKLLTITPGTTVEWVDEAGRHSVVADDGSFKSDVLKQGDKFEHKFDKAGAFAYHCEFHGDSGGKDMAGKIVVRGHAGNSPLSSQLPNAFAPPRSSCKL